MERLSARMKRTGGTLTSVPEIIAALVEGEKGWPELLPESIYRATHDTEDGFSGRNGRRCVRLPFDYVMRDLNVGVAASGGNLVGSPRMGHTPSLMGFSVLADAGARVIDLGAGENPPGLPTITTPPVAGWVADEFGDVPQSDTVFGLRNVSPKTCGFWFKVTRRLLLQGGPAADELLRTEILRAIGRGIDKAALQGTGSGGQPLGLNGISGVHAQAGATLSWAGIQNMLEAVTNGGARDSSVRFIGTSGVRELLATRERAAGSGLVWDGASIAGRPADVSLECPAATLFAGDFSNLCIAVHGGLSIQVDEQRQVDGSARIIALTDVDVFATYAAAFSRATSIT